MSVLLDHEVLRLFEQLSQIPRESGSEKPVSDWIKSWAEDLDLQVDQDESWNLVIRKPASAGYEDHPPVIMQAHMDMVCEKNGDSDHDFTKDPIYLKIDGDWLMSASGTSLGADNGIGVAAAMAILEDRSLPHPPLEVVFTVQEETTFEGAETVDKTRLESRRMINLDHAKDDELICGSCGGIGIEFTMPITRESSMPDGLNPMQLTLGGLKGGHSGEDIHRGRGNAIELLLRMLEDIDVPVCDISGGTNRLAIPREASALVLTDDEASLRAKATEFEETFRKEIGEAAKDLAITCEPAKNEGVEAPPITGESLSRIAAAIKLYPNGIVSMNGSLEGVVESSDNIGIISTGDSSLCLTSEIRGGHKSSVDNIKKTIELIGLLFGADIRSFDAYEPWEFSADSDLRALAADTYRELFGEDMRQLALHAGLECGTFAKAIPGLDIIALGPNCEYFHSPQERVSISSTEKFYGFLTRLLARL